MQLLVRSARAVVLTLLLVLVVPLAPAPAAEGDPDGQAPRERASDAEFDEIAGVARAEGSVRVIIGLRAAFAPEGTMSQAESQDQREGIARARADLREDLEGTDYEELRTFESVPYVAMVLSGEAVDRLRTSDHVDSVMIDESVPPALAQSGPLVQAPQMWDDGFTGEGFMVAILDTGVESGHPFFGDRVTEEACYSSTSTIPNTTTLCPDGSEEQVGEGAGEDCVPEEVAGCGHGTHVAGIAAGEGPDFSGVAPGADIMAVQVFSQFNNDDDCPGDAPCARTFVSDQMSALERVHELQGDGAHSFAAVNMSLGSGQEFDACDEDPRKSLIDNLRSAGVATVISSGNAAFVDSVGRPGCISTAVTVGSTTKSDDVSIFSNNHPTMVDLLAPGTAILSSVVGGGFAGFSGTSMAAPHVAGAWAVLRQHADAADAAAALTTTDTGTSASVSAILEALQETGLMVEDERDDAGYERPRIRLFHAAQFEPEVGSISGTVTGDDTGEPIAGAMVAVDGPVSDSVETGGDGSYAVEDLLPGDYELTVSADGYASASRDVTVSPDATAVEDVTLEALPGAVAGTVTDAVSGALIEGASVEIDGEQVATTDGDGTYVVEDLAPGEYIVDVSADGYESGSSAVEVEADETATADVALDRVPPLVGATGDEATAEHPLVATVFSPFGGPIEGAVDAAIGEAPAGWVLADRQLEFNAPDATAGNPIVVEFRLHTSRLADGQSAEDVHVAREGDFLADCDGPTGFAEPDPCVASRVDDGDEVFITIRTTQASVWHLLRPEVACPAGLDLPFGDVNPGSVHAASIACVAYREVASGAGEGRYDPSRRVTRGQMATFVAQALAAAGFVLPDAGDQGFTDVSGVHATSINNLVAAEIVGGTSATTFNPGGFVRRAQMATFLVGAVEWALDIDLEPEDGPHFTDTEDNRHEDNIDIAFELGLTAGAGEGLFAPSANVNRAPMASFLTNLLEGLWPDPAIPEPAMVGGDPEPT